MVAARIPSIATMLLAICTIDIASAADRRRDPEVPARDPRGYWRQMTLDDATSTSKCVGKFDTPVCAVETVVACFARSRWDLCNDALDAPERFEPSRYAPLPHYKGMRYRLVWTQRLTQAAIDDIPRAATHERPGDLRIDVLKRSCYMYAGAESCRPATGDPNIFTLRKVGDRWVVLDWSVEDIRWPTRPQR
jgi:hypothetical protein